MLPTRHTAGDSFRLRIEPLADYPAADGWELGLTLVSPALAVTLNAVSDASGYLITALPVATAQWQPGSYTWALFASRTDERVTLSTGRIDILLNLAGAVGGLDARGSARKALDAVNAALETYGAKAYLQEIQLGDRRQRFNSPSEFMAFRSRLIREAAAEDAAAGRGPALNNRLLVRFRR